jgi:DNA polymerase delta subunit 3
MAAFGKAKPKLKRENTDTSSADVSAAASPAADSLMLDVSEDEEDSYVPPVVDKEKVDEGRKARKEREAALKRMMEDDDGEDEDVVEKVEEKTESEDAEDDDVMDIENPVVKAKAEEQKEYVEVSNGRRRGRRRVMKKKTIKDEEGYLGKFRIGVLIWLLLKLNVVTREEPAWESFSEDEPVAKKKAPSASSFGSTKGKKPAGKGGQGNIMSFFGKKT